MIAHLLNEIECEFAAKCSLLDEHVPHPASLRARLRISITECHGPAYGRRGCAVDARPLFSVRRQNENAETEDQSGAHNSHNVEPKLSSTLAQTCGLFVGVELRSASFLSVYIENYVDTPPNYLFLTEIVLLI